MKTIEEQLQFVTHHKKIGLMTHVVIGFPSLEDSYKVIEQMVAGGADVIELQIPFSDPLADGSTIMEANDQALENGVTLDDCLQFMRQVSQRFTVPFLFMGYYNSVFHRGVQQFCAAAAQAGCQGLIIPDIPIDEESHEGFIAACQQNKLHHIRLLSPTSTDERIQLNAQYQNGFVYCTSRAGTTGTNSALDPAVKDFLTRVKRYITVPLALGFGISRPEQVRALIGHAQVAVVGSAVIEQIQQNGVESVREFVEKLTLNSN